MIKLSDYLDYLNSEIIQARKNADEQAIIVAKQYAEDPYLKYFRVPRFSMPSIKMSIPIKITDLNADHKYSFEMDDTAFVNDVNKRLDEVNIESDHRIPHITIDHVKEDTFQEVIHKLAKAEQPYVTNVNHHLDHIDFGTIMTGISPVIISPVIISPVISPDISPEINPDIRPITNLDPTSDLNPKLEFSPMADEKDPNSFENPKMAEVIKEAFRNRYKTVATKLNGILFDPDTTRDTDKDKLFLTLDVEMVEEGIRINTVKDKDGNIVEEITFE